jgi:hypothetical protein
MDQAESGERGYITTDLESSAVDHRPYPGTGAPKLHHAPAK